MLFSMNKVLNECKSVLINHYGEQFKGLILFGSNARNEANESSDIDLLVLLRKPFDYFHEIKVVIDLLYQIQLEHKKFISAKVADSKEYESGSIQLYRNIQREGIFV